MIPWRLQVDFEQVTDVDLKAQGIGFFLGAPDNGRCSKT